MFDGTTNADNLDQLLGFRLLLRFLIGSALMTGLSACFLLNFELGNLRWHADLDVVRFSADQVL